MHITRVEPFHVNWGKSKSAWVRIWTDTGLYGLGEASPMAYGNASLEISLTWERSPGTAGGDREPAAMEATEVPAPGQA